MNKDVESPYFGNLSFSGTDTVVTVNMKATSSDGRTKIYNATLGSLQTMSYSIHMDRHPIRQLGNVNANDYVMGPRTIAGSLVFAVFNKHWIMDILSKMENDKFADNITSILSDELPPFDLIVSLANEYGVKSRLAIYGVRLVNEGQVMSVNDIYTENTYQYFANDIGYLTEENSGNSGSIGYTRLISMKSSNIYNSSKRLYGSSLEGAIKNNNDANKLTREATIKNHDGNALTGPIIIPSVINLNVQAFSPKSVGVKGVARFSLSPRQSTGILYISGSGLSNTLSIDISLFLKSDGLNGDINVELYPGQYSAIYRDQDKKKTSNQVEFAIIDFIQSSNSVSVAPTILNRNEDSLTLSKNKNTHNTIYYAEVNNDKTVASYSSIPANQNKTIITNLGSNKTYRIYSSDGNSDSSDCIDVTTLASNEIPYSDMKQYISSNSNKILENTTVQNYLDNIDAAYSISIKQYCRISCQDAFVLLLQQLITQRNTITKENYKTIYEYNDAMNKVTLNINVVNNLIAISQDKVNNEHYVLNYVNANTKPLDQPKFNDVINSIISIPPLATRLDIYDFDNKLFKTVHSNNFSSGNLYTFIGKPGQKYYAFAIDSIEQKSPEFEMFIPNDTDRIRDISLQSQDLSNYNSNYIESESDIKNYLNSTAIDSNTYNDLVLLNAKNNCISVAGTPTIIYADKNRIDVDISSLDSLGYNNTSYYAVISLTGKAFSSAFFRKKKFNVGDSIVSFTAIDDFVRANESYLFWIEDINNNQISKCMTLNMEDNSDQAEIKNSFILNDIKNGLLSILATKLDITSDINICINSAFEDEDATTKNIYSLIIKNVVNYDAKYIDIPTVLKAILECNIQTKGVVDSSFFDSNILIDTIKNIIILPMRNTDYTAIVYKITNDGVMTYDSISVNENCVQDILIDDKSYKYWDIVCIDQNPLVKSDIVFIDRNDDTYKSLENKIEVIK